MGLHVAKIMLTKEIRDVGFPGKGVDKGGSAKAFSIKLPTKQQFGNGAQFCNLTYFPCQVVVWPALS
jgi:hypothetical protein